MVPRNKPQKIQKKIPLFDGLPPYGECDQAMTARFISEENRRISEIISLIQSFLTKWQNYCQLSDA